MTKSFHVASEKQTGSFFFDAVDQDGAAVALAAVNTIKMSLYLETAPTEFINSRNAQNVLNTNNCTFSSVVAGRFVWTAQVADMALLDRTKLVERHVAVVRIGFNSSTEFFQHQFVIDVAKVENIPL